jgi:hypothetical protein
MGVVLGRLAKETEAKRFKALKPFLLEDKGGRYSSGPIHEFARRHGWRFLGGYDS